MQSRQNSNYLREKPREIHKALCSASPLLCLYMFPCLCFCGTVGNILPLINVRGFALQTSPGSLPCLHKYCLTLWWSEGLYELIPQRETAIIPKDNRSSFWVLLTLKSELITMSVWLFQALSTKSLGVQMQACCSVYKLNLKPGWQSNFIWRIPRMEASPPCFQW